MQRLRWTLLLLCFGLWLGVGCENNPQSNVQLAQQHVTSRQLYGLIPENASMIWRIGNLPKHALMLERLSQVWPQPNQAPCIVLTQTFGKQACTAEFWSSSPLRPDAPMVLFKVGQGWNILGSTKGDLEQARTAWYAKVKPEQAPLMFHGTEVVQIGLGSPVVPHVKPWSQSPIHRAVQDTFFLSDAPVAGLLDLSALITELPTANDDAKRLQHAMAQEFGAVGFKLFPHKDELRSNWSLYTKEGGAQVEASGASDQATKPLRSSLGALIRPGILGVLRLSTNPKLLFQWWRATLAPKQRVEVDRLLERLKTEYALELEQAIFENLHGHMIVVLYGFEPDKLSLGTEAFLGALMSLDATQEVIYMPIENRQPLEELLNAATQLSQGRLKQQRDKSVIQYAWFDDDELRWALILHDDYLLFVDAPATFTHGTKHIRNPQPLNAKWAAKGLESLMAPSPRRSGFYLDAQTLRQLLPEDAKQLRQMLEPVDVVTLTSDQLSTDASLYVVAQWSLTLGWKAP